MYESVYRMAVIYLVEDLSRQIKADGCHNGSIPYTSETSKLCSWCAMHRVCTVLAGIHDIQELVLLCML